MVDNGDGPQLSAAAAVIQGWQATLSPLDAVYHQVRGGRCAAPLWMAPSPVCCL